MESSKTAGFNRLRGFLPTLGNVMELDPMAAAWMLARRRHVL